MKTYFELKGYKVQDCSDQSWANYEINPSHHSFTSLEHAVLFCIGLANGCDHASRLESYSDTFMTMINKHR